MAKKKVEKEIVLDASDANNVSVTPVGDENVACTATCDESVQKDLVELEKTDKSATKAKSKKVSDIAKDKELAELRRSMALSKDELSKHLAENERLSDELDVAVRENKQLRKELSKCKQDYKKAQGDNRANAALVETLDGELTRYKVRNDEMVSTISRLQANIKKYSDELALKDAEISEWQFDVARLEAELSKFKSMTLWQRIKFVFFGYKVFKDLQDGEIEVEG